MSHKNSVVSIFANQDQAEAAIKDGRIGHLGFSFHDGPEAFTEVRFLAHYKQNLALKLIPQFSVDFAKAFGRENAFTRRFWPRSTIWLAAGTPVPKTTTS